MSLRKFLLSRNKNWLVDELVSAAESNPALADRLAAKAGLPAGVSPLIERLDTALESGVGIDYSEAIVFAYRVGEVVDDIEEMVSAGRAAEAIPILEHAVGAFEEVFPYVDDSDGDLQHEFGRVLGLHVGASEQCEVDRISLASKLFGWAIGSGFGFSDTARSRYRQALGTEGLAAFDTLVERDFDELPVLRPGDDRVFSGHRSTVTFLMKDIAGERGTDELVGVLERDLSSSYSWLEIAETLQSVDRREDALTYVKRGQAAFPNTADTRLLVLEAELQAESGRFSDAVDVAWMIFRRVQRVEDYERLRNYAVQDGTWSRWRDSALEFLGSRPPAPTNGRGPGHSALVDVFLWEGNVVEAWKAAESGGCTDSRWLDLARHRDSAVSDAVPVYEREIVRLVSGADRRAYASAARLAVELGELTDRTGRGEQFAAWIRQLRAENARRPAFQNEFDRAGLPR